MIVGTPMGRRKPGYKFALAMLWARLRSEVFHSVPILVFENMNSHSREHADHENKLPQSRQARAQHRNEQTS